MNIKTLSIITITLLALSQPSIAALNAYLVLTGDTQGDIKGDVTIKGREDTIEVNAFSHLLSTVPDRNVNCTPSGREHHLPVKITKRIDKSTPMLMQALTDNENLTATLKFYRPDRTGIEEHYFTIELIGVKIAGINQEMLNNKYPENMQHEVREHISFTYERIVKTYEPEAIATEARWSSQCGQNVLTSDLNHDGIVNIIDLSIMAAEWAKIGI